LKVGSYQNDWRRAFVRHDDGLSVNLQTSSGTSVAYRPEPVCKTVIEPR